jgi:hypothetical protein
MFCLIADIEWSPEAAEVLHSLTNGLIIQAQVAGYTQDGLPEVYLYACLAKDVSTNGFISIFQIFSEYKSFVEISKSSINQSETVISYFF